MLQRTVQELTKGECGQAWDQQTMERKMPQD